MVSVSAEILVSVHLYVFWMWKVSTKKMMSRHVALDYLRWITEVLFQIYRCQIICRASPVRTTFMIIVLKPAIDFSIRPSADFHCLWNNGCIDFFSKSFPDRLNHTEIFDQFYQRHQDVVLPKKISIICQSVGLF